MTRGSTANADTAAVDDTRPSKSTQKPADILLVEDDTELAKQTASALAVAGFNVRWAASLERAASEININIPDVLILDRMLPDGEALEYLQSLRGRQLDVPTLILSALGETEDRIQGLEHGADDYLAKPFDIHELVARVSALLRRATLLSREQTLKVGELEMDIVNRRVLHGAEEISLQPREFKLLEFLARNAGEVVTKTMLLKSVWGLEFDPQTNVVEVHISRLRAKLDRGREEKLLHTIRGNGYSLHS